jgi:hypothetical protein
MLGKVRPSVGGSRLFAIPARDIVEGNDDGNKNGIDKNK